MSNLTRQIATGSCNVFRLGATAVGVPGNVKGLHYAWKKFGKLDWKSLLQPVIDRAMNGFEFPHATATTLKWKSAQKRVRADPGLR